MMGRVYDVMVCESVARVLRACRGCVESLC